MKTAFVFSGQGAQYFGMGSELFQKEKVVRNTFQEASEALNFDIGEICFTENPFLNETEYTQSAILTVSIACYRLLLEKGFKPDIVAGLSLGEYSALVASGVFSFFDAVKLVSKRGKYMAQAAPAGTGKMVAVLNADRLLIEEACKEAASIGIVSPANYNTAGQIVIGGETAAVDEACRLLKEKGVKRLVPLKVSGPFHTALLKPAAEKLAVELEKQTFAPLRIPVVSNTTAQRMTEDLIKGLLIKQVMSAVRFEDSILTMKNLGIKTIIEVGPGKVLSGFIKKIDASLLTSHVEDEKTLAETINVLTRG